MPDVGYRDGKRVVQFGLQVLHENITAVYTLVGNSLAFSCFQVAHVFFQRVDIVARDGQNHITVDPAVSLGKTRDVLVFHLHLGVQLVQEHFPLVIIAFPVNHLGHPCRLFFTVMRV